MLLCGKKKAVTKENIHILAMNKSALLTIFAQKMKIIAEVETKKAFDLFISSTYFNRRFFFFNFFSPSFGQSMNLDFIFSN